MRERKVAERGGRGTEREKERDVERKRVKTGQERGRKDRNRRERVCDKKRV